MIELRPYQQRAVDDLRAAFGAGYKRAVLSAPTGSGKTEVAMHIIEGAAAKGRRALFICDLLTLVDQTSQRMTDAGIVHSVIQGNRKVNWGARVFVCSSQTLERRNWPIELGLVIIDEAHSQRKAVLEKIVELGVKSIGLTATPFSEGMGATWQTIVTVTTTNALIRDKFLVPVRAYQGVEIDMSGAKLDRKGEYKDSEVSVRTADVVGAAIPEWVKFCHSHFGGPAQTLVFTRTIRDGEGVCKEFRDAGYDFAQVTAHDDRDDRKLLMDKFRRGDLMGLVSCHALAKGLDVPAVSVMVDMNPLRKSLAMHIQKLGRIMRPAPGKEFGLVLDHAGNWGGFYDEVAHFFAHGADTLDAGLSKTIRAEPEYRPKACFRCNHILPPKAEECPSCGADVRSHNVVTTAPGKMVKANGLNGEDAPAKDPWPSIVWLAQKKFSDRERARIWARVQFKNLTGDYPMRRQFVAANNPDSAIVNKVDGMYKNWLIRQRKAEQKRAAT